MFEEFARLLQNIAPKILFDRYRALVRSLFEHPERPYTQQIITSFANCHDNFVEEESLQFYYSYQSLEII